MLRRLVSSFIELIGRLKSTEKQNSPALFFVKGSAPKDRRTALTCVSLSCPWASEARQGSAPKDCRDVRLSFLSLGLRGARGQRPKKLEQVVAAPVCAA